MHNIVSCRLLRPQPLNLIGMSTSAEQAENNSRSWTVEAFSFQLRMAESELKVNLLGACTLHLVQEAILSTIWYCWGFKLLLKLGFILARIWRIDIRRANIVELQELVEVVSDSAFPSSRSWNIDSMEPVCSIEAVGFGMKVLLGSGRVARRLLNCRQVVAIAEKKDSLKLMSLDTTMVLVVGT